MTTIQLTQKLVSIPSYVRDKTNEERIGEFIFRYLKSIPGLKVSKQRLGNGRSNIIAETKGRPRLLLAGHMDTVEPKQGWQRDQFQGVLEGPRLYGLGALDTKAGIAAAISALAGLTEVSGLTLLFYCDEEYDLQGMQRFIKQTKRKGLWELAVVLEPTDLKLWNAHKGLIEISFSVQGVSGHAANPESGKSAIDVLSVTLAELKVWLRKSQDQVLGTPSLNIAYIRGGLNQGVNREREIILGKEGNNIADFAEATVDIRPTKTTLRAKDVLTQIKASLKKRGVRMLDYVIRHDLSSLNTDRKRLKALQHALKKSGGKVECFNGKNAGYGDGQLLAEKLRIPVAYIGPKGKNAHGPNEWVDISSIEQLRRTLIALLKNCCQ